ncbi:hypothetical protein F4677DRAFT_39179 [Hypoxylon crocopeplum]|nr:hypothetical protein F4677DRAFT_39179 [Hypoxylon crocopeplum]
MAPSTAVAVRQAKEHIGAIRRAKGLDDKLSNRTRGIVADLEGALKVLSDQLYHESTHFLLEMIQNADDASYADGVTPSIRFTLNSRTLQIDCNEKGFTPDNVESICSVAHSTKVGHGKAMDYVGEKGIGFKSVFKVASVVWISSRSYSFKFDGNEPLGMIAPIWDEAFPGVKTEGWTSFFLELRPDCDVEILAKDLQKLEHKAMIFLRRLRGIAVDLKQTTPPQAFDIRVAEEGGAGSGAITVTLQKNNDTERFVVMKKQVEVLPGEGKRAGAKTTTITAAFPITEDNQPRIQHQSTYSFLPIRDYGFKFLLNADFILTANRQDIVTSNAWNLKLAQESLVAVYEFFVTLALKPPYASLQYTWMRYLPEDAPRGTLFSSNFDVMLLQKLGEAKLLLSEAGAVEHPDTLQYVPEDFRDSEGTALSLSSVTAPSYLSRKYSDDDIESLKKLKVQSMEPSRFLVDLDKILQPNRRDPAHNKKTYISSLAKALIRLIGDERFAAEIRKLPIIRIRDGGTFVAATAGGIFFPGDEGDFDIPEGVNAMVVQPRFAGNRDIKVLYNALDVKQLSKVDICQLIITTHTHPTFEAGALDVNDLISHATFLFKSQFEDKALSSEVVVVTDEGQYVRAKHVYQSTHDQHSAERYLRHTGRCHFIHPGYFEGLGNQTEKFRQWLRNHMNISHIPRLMQPKPSGRFQLTPEFKSLMDGTSGVSSAEVLVLLRDNWSTSYSQWFPSQTEEANPLRAVSATELQQELSWFSVDCIGGSRSPLCQTPFPFSDWISWKDRVPLLDIPELEDPRWKFLEDFGVSVKKSAGFYLRCLENLAEQGHPEPGSKALVNSLYDGIQDWLGDGEDLVRKVFNSKPLVYIPASDAEHPGMWIGLARCIWDGPTLRHFKSIASHYPSHSRLFRDILQVKDLEVDNLLYELEHLRPDEQLEYIAGTWRFLNKWRIQKASGTPATWTRLAQALAFPITMCGQATASSNRYRLADARAKSEWYIPDTEDLFTAFSGKIPALSFELDTIQELKDLFKVMGLESRFLSTATKATPVTDGSTTTMNLKYTNLLVKDKLEYLLRLIPESDKDRQSIINKLRNLTVLTAETLKKRMSVTYQGKPTHGNAIPASALLEERDGKLRIYLLREHIEKKTHYLFQFVLAKELAAFCRVDEKLHPLVHLVVREKNDAVIRHAFAQEGVRRLTVEEDVIKASYFQNIHEAEAEDVGKPMLSDCVKALALGYERAYRKVKIRRGGRTREDKKGKAKARSKDKREKGKADGKSKSEGSGARDSNNNRFTVLDEFFDSDGSDRTVVYHLDSDGDSSSSSGGEEKGGDDNATYTDARLVLVTEGSKSLRSYRRKRRRQRAAMEVDEEVAVAGEWWLSKYFKATMPGFFNAEQHWTSTRRKEVGEKAVEAADVDACTSTFTVPDHYGAFTRFLVSLGRRYKPCERWLSAPPTYHVEVVSTEKGASSYFVLGKDWWSMARENRLPDGWEGNASAVPPRNVCILARVFRLGSEDQNVMFFLDPWSWFTKQKLSVEAEDLYIGRVLRSGDN